VLCTSDFYHGNFPGDTRFIKALGALYLFIAVECTILTATRVLQVYGVALLDVAQTIMVTADAFHWFVYR
jgi:hypothetical protein